MGPQTIFASPAFTTAANNFYAPSHTQFLHFFFYNSRVILPRMFHNISFEPRTLRATEARLEAIYRSAKAGLKGDSLALASGMLPKELRQLFEFDPAVELAELKGRADSEMEAAEVINCAITNGDAKMALEKLRFQHQWVAKQQIDINVDQQISITGALEQAERRVLEAVWTDVSALEDQSDGK
jgi:hypothetical protein